MTMPQKEYIGQLQTLMKKITKNHMTTIQIHLCQLQNRKLMK
ncbi:uncharacterized protein METZ01_LOCUS158777 [marine metagenome]|uniref:Uncharacterized protein n=1 Tax=marine metagenome TaxID=408172 RepID=A0A382AY44_9ZZZZ